MYVYEAYIYLFENREKFGKMHSRLSHELVGELEGEFTNKKAKEKTTWEKQTRYVWCDYI